MIKQIMIFGSGLLVGVAGGFIFKKKQIESKTKYLGNLRIDNSDPDVPNSLFLELTADIGTLKQADTAIFKVVNESYIRSNNNHYNEH